MRISCCKKHRQVDGKKDAETRILEVNEYSPRLNVPPARKHAQDIRYDSTELRKYPRNISETTKYNLFTFLPKSLMFQFKKYTNIYFGLLLIPAFFDVVAAYKIQNELPPFLFILLVALIRELIEDLRRHRSDRYEQLT